MYCVISTSYSLLHSSTPATEGVGEPSLNTLNPTASIQGFLTTTDEHLHPLQSLPITGLSLGPAENLKHPVWFFKCAVCFCRTEPLPFCSILSAQHTGLFHKYLFPWINCKKLSIEKLKGNVLFKMVSMAGGIISCFCFCLCFLLFLTFGFHENNMCFYREFGKHKKANFL